MVCKKGLLWYKAERVSQKLPPAPLQPKTLKAMAHSLPPPPKPGPGRLFPTPDAGRSLNTDQLDELEKSFRAWAASSANTSYRFSRLRIVLIFLLIRYTGARLNEVLSLDPAGDIDCATATIRFRKKTAGRSATIREVRIPAAIAEDIRQIITDPHYHQSGSALFQIDPAHVRRKFYDQAAMIGLPHNLGAPESIRKSRAVELLQSNVPLPVVQQILGHSTPNLAASYVEFSEAELQQAARYFTERENLRRTSARNSFYGKIAAIRQGDVQALIEIVATSGITVTAIITSDSLTRIGLQIGMLVRAEVKAPWVQLSKEEAAPHCSAENVFAGTVSRMVTGRISTEVVIELLDGTELCAIITEQSRRKMKIKSGDQLWAFFDAFAVIIHAD